MWGAAMLAHQLKAKSLFQLDHQFYLTLATIWLMLKPWQVERLAFTAAVQIVTAAITAPWITNHWMFVTLINIGIVSIYLYSRWRDGEIANDPEFFYEQIAPPIRVALILLYFYVTLAKFTAGFFDPETSCATEMYSWLRNKLTFLPESTVTDYGSIYGTLIIEAALPVLLVFRKTRIWAIVIGWLFHSVLTINLFFAFAMTMYAGYAFFLPSNFPELARQDRVGQVLGRAWWRFSQAWWAFPLSFAGLFACGLVGLGNLPLFDSLQLRIGQIAVMGSTLVFVVVLVRATWGRNTVPIPQAFRMNKVSQWVAPALILLNGLSPYLGLKTENSFTMFSNVQTEGNLWNQLVLPQRMRIFSFQDYLVRIVESSDRDFQRAADANARYVYWHFRRDATERPEASVSYLYKGKFYDVPRIADDPILGKPVNPYLKKFVWFRLVADPKNNGCTH